MRFGNFRPNINLTIFLAVGHNWQKTLAGAIGEEMASAAYVDREMLHSASSPPLTEGDSPQISSPPVRFPKSFGKNNFKSGTAVLRIGENNRHTILSASQELCDLLEHSEDQVANRSLSLLSGPDTDLSMLLLAIKSLSIHRSMTVPPMKIYGRNGTSHQVVAKCQMDGKGCCCLHVKWRASSDLPASAKSWGWPMQAPG